MGQVTETFVPKPMAASGVVSPAPGALGGFFCTTAGSIQIRDGLTVAGTVVVATFAVAVGTYYPMPFGFSVGIYAELTGAAGTFGIS